jgi:colanic acid biosynthesis protein WcaH
LLGLRKNAPAQGFWFNLGGRIFKNETIEQAQARIFMEETGMSLNRDTLKFLGVSDHIYEDNLFEIPEFGTHYVCLAYEVTVNSNDLPMMTDQHSDYVWRDVPTLLRSDDVHENTKICFKF